MLYSLYVLIPFVTSIAWGHPALRSDRSDLLERGLTGSSRKPPPRQGVKDSGQFTYKGYIVDNCGGLGATVLNAIDSAISALQLASQDASLGSQSSHGFSAFFGPSTSKDYLTTLFTNMIDGAGVPVRTISPINRILPPKIVCSTPDMWYNLITRPCSRSLYSYCRDRSSTVAFHSEYWNAIFLCPVFFQYAEKPTGRHCPEVDVFANEWKGDETAFAEYQSYILIHELIHLYSGDRALGGNTDPPEFYGWNDCMQLPADLSLRNPDNYRFYVACES